MLINGVLAFSILSIYYFQSALSFNASSLHLSSVIIHNPNTTSHLLKDVVKEISKRQKWDLNDVRVSDGGVRNVRVGGSRSCECRMRVEKSELVFKFSDELGPWRKQKERRELVDLLGEIRSNSALEAFELEGPFELRVDGGEELSLVLPLNITHTGLKRLLVGEGITVKIEGAREVSLYHHSYDFGVPVNRSGRINEERNQFQPFVPSSCIPLPSIHIVGSALLSAHRTRNPNSKIEIASLSQNMVELLAEKCYYGQPRNRKLGCPIDSLSPKLALLEKLIQRLIVIEGQALQSGMSVFLKSKITVTTLVSFQLKIERNVRNNDTMRGTLAEWKTKPAVERAYFEVTARVEEEKLKPLEVKRFRPFIIADSASWSTLMSNISFTKIPSLLVSPEALTLDVKW
ncbi:hypothetical protein Scep_000481 [Stephania cephalantha]|uniref:Uncharacterized protein n=1 Tax=Stephania cephalantha TaxID=152367 RepID=A0AAP0L778_9MAGN